MPAILPTTPTVAKFTEAWTKKFAETVKVAAGKDGRLSLTEARRMSELAGGASLFSDNAVAYLKAKGQATVSAAVLVEAGRKHALSSATSAAGADGKLSLADGAKLANDLKADFFYLRGKGPIDPPVRTDAELKALVSSIVLKSIDDGTAVKLPAAPAIVRGRRSLIDHLPHPASNTRVSAVMIAQGQVYFSRASPVPSPLVGWYRAGPAPQ